MSDSSPPRTTICPSCTSTFDSIELLLVVGPCSAFTVEATTLETSWKICMRIVPFSLICGRTRSVRPTSLRSIVWKGFTEPLLAPVLVNWPVTKGTFWPTTILASSLSRVSRFGVDSTLPASLFCRKFAIEVRMNLPAILLTVPMLMPPDGSTLPTVPFCVARFTMFCPPMVKFVPITPTVPLFVLFTGVCHWMPNCDALSSLTCAIRPSM